MTNVTVDTARNQSMIVAKLQSDRPIRSEIRMRSVEQRETQCVAHDTCGEWTGAKRIVRERQYGRCRPYQRQPPAGYRKEQEKDLPRIFAVVDDRDGTAAPAVRRANRHHRDDGDNAHCARKPEGRYAQLNPCLPIGIDRIRLPVAA